MLGLLLLYI